MRGEGQIAGPIPDVREAFQKMRPTLSAPQPALDAGLAFTLALLAATVATHSRGLFVAMLASHMLLRIYDGRFAGWRTASWLTLVLAQLALVVAGFLGYVLPWGQISFWLAARFGIVVPLSLDPVLPFLDLIFWASFFADVFALHDRRLRQRRTWLAIAFAALALCVPTVVLDVLHLSSSVPATGPPKSVPIEIIPNFSVSATFAILRSVPSKPLAIAVAAFVLLLPAAAAWTRGWRLLAPPTHLAWLACVAGLALCWIGLGVLGRQPATEIAQWIARAFVAYQILFFLVVPVALGRAVAPPDDDPTSPPRRDPEPATRR